MRYALFLCAALAGCAGQQITPQQRAAILQYQLQQQQLQQQQAGDLAGTYTAPARAAPAQQQQFTCTTRNALGATTVTNCQ